MSDDDRRRAIQDSMNDLGLNVNQVAAGAKTSDKTLRRLLAGEGKTNASTLSAIEAFLESARAKEKAKWASTPEEPGDTSDTLVAGWEAVRNGHYEKAQALALLDVAESLRELRREDRWGL